MSSLGKLRSSSRWTNCWPSLRISSRNNSNKGGEVICLSHHSEPQGKKLESSNTILSAFAPHRSALRKRAKTPWWDHTTVDHHGTGERVCTQPIKEEV